MNCYGLTDVGKVRSLNEDSFAVKTISENIVASVVADGMGGHNAGEEASKFAAEEIIRLIEEASKFFEKYTDKQICNFLKNAVNKINKALYLKASESKELSGMGTTMVVCLFYNKKFYVANVGDSRLYKYNGTLTQITKDHSYVSELLEMGMITKEQAKNHPNRNVITKAVGTEPTVIPDVFVERANPGDMCVICSDGLTNMVAEDVISNIISDNITIESKAEKLINLAKENGGKDNITVVLIENDNGGEQ